MGGRGGEGWASISSGSTQYGINTLPRTASVLLINMLFCFSGDAVFVEELDCDDVPVTNVFSLSVSDVSFRLAS